MAAARGWDICPKIGTIFRPCPATPAHRPGAAPTGNGRPAADTPVEPSVANSTRGDRGQDRMRPHADAFCNGGHTCQQRPLRVLWPPLRATVRRIHGLGSRRMAADGLSGDTGTHGRDASGRPHGPYTAARPRSPAAPNRGQPRNRRIILDIGQNGADGKFLPRTAHRYGEACILRPRNGQGPPQ